MESTTKNHKWPANWEARYRVYQQEKAINGCRLLLILGLVLFPSFSLLDLISHPEAISGLSLIRYLTTFVFFLLLIAQHKGWLSVRKHPVLLAISTLAIASLSITLMCIQLDGYASEYYAGVNLVVLAAGLVIPWRPAHMAVAVSAVILIYLFGVAWSAEFPLEQPNLLLSNLAFLLGTGVIGVASANLAETSRRESFTRFFTLEEAQKSLLVRDNFLSIASHELKSPLTSLRLQLQMASRHSEECGAAPAICRALDMSLAQVKRITSLTEDLLDVTRMANGKLQLCMEPVNLSELAAQAVEQHRHLLADAGIDLTLDAPEAAIVEGDRERLEQVIVNLLTNASKYGNGKPVRISVLCESGETLLTVEDRGIGISKENLHKIFERFERAEAGPGVSGLGLGLYISRNIVQSHRGEIFVESKKGIGTKFTVKLPARDSLAPMSTVS